MKWKYENNWMTFRKAACGSAGGYCPPDFLLIAPPPPANWNIPGYATQLGIVSRIQNIYKSSKLHSCSTFVGTVPKSNLYSEEQSWSFLLAYSLLTLSRSEMAREKNCHLTLVKTNEISNTFLEGIQEFRCQDAKKKSKNLFGNLKLSITPV